MTDEERDQPATAPSSPEAIDAPLTDDLGPEVVGRSGPGFGRALSWSYVLTSGRTFMTLLVSLILARLLGPEAFGTIAMASVFVLFIEMFVRQGLVAAIVQRPHLTKDHLDTAFWMTVMAIVALVPATIGASGWWAGVNQLPELRDVIIALTALMPLKGLGVVQEALVRRQMDFKLLAVRTNVAVLVGGLAGIASAFLGAGIWSLVIQQLSTAAIELALIWKLTTWRPSWNFRPDCARELLGFSSRTALASLGSFVNLRSDALLIGLFFGPVVVGLYRMAVRFVDISLDLAAGALQSVFLPELARHADDGDAFNDRTVEVVRVGSLLAVPILGSLAAASDPLMALVGDEWVPAADALKVLCVLAAVQAMSMFLGPILQAAGRPGVLAWLTWISAGLSAATFVGAGFLLSGAAEAAQVVWIATIRTVVFVPTLFVIVFPVLRRTLGLTGTRLVAAIWPSTVAALSGFGLVWGLRRVVGSQWQDPPLVGIVLSGGLALVCSVGILLLLDPVARTLPPRLLRGRSRARSPREGEAEQHRSPSDIHGEYR